MKNEGLPTAALRHMNGMKPLAPVELNDDRPELPNFMFQPLRMRALEFFNLADQPLPKVMSLVAPIGYGKTVLMSALLGELRRIGKQCIWYALDERDSQAEAVIGAIEALLHGQQSKVHPTQALFRGHVPIDTRIDGLVELVNAHPLPVTIFIDNLHWCTDPALGQLLDRLVFKTRPTVQWVLSSNRDLPFDVSRAELQGQIRKLGAAELSFDLAEVEQLLGADLCARIGPEGVEEVMHETEGWPAGVRMAQIILANDKQAPATRKLFSGSDETLAHLLNRQVLSGLPAEVRDFLFSIVHLRTFCLELCVHVTGSEQAKAHLDYLTDRNVFVIPLDRKRHWYRLHGLFREFVLSEAERNMSAERREQILTRAAQWCERQGDWREAVDYALASGSVATTRPILEHIAAPFVRDQGHVLQYIEWLETLHAQGHQADPEAEYWYAWALAFRRRYDDARQQIGKLATRIQRQGRKAAVAQASDLQRRIAILRASIDSLSDRLEDAHRGAADWLAGATADDDPFNVTAAHCIECHYFINSFMSVDARQAIQAAHESAFQAHSSHVDAWVSIYAALIDIDEGNYAIAYPELVASLSSARASLGDDSNICGTMSMVAAKCAVEMGLDSEAWQLFEFGVKTSRTHGFLDAAACGLDAAVKLWKGGKDDRISIARLREIASCYPIRLSLMLSCFLVRRLLNLGRADEARDEAERIGISPDGKTPRRRWQELDGIARLDALIEATRIDLLIAGGQFKLAESLIASEVRRAKAVHCAAQNVTLALCSAEIALRGSEPALAIRHVTRAISLAATRMIVRPFTDHADCLAAVVADTKVSAWGFATAEERLFFADRCRTLPFADAALRDRLAGLNEEQPQLLSPLTSREMELLGYIDAGLSNQQIADRIDVSLPTVKWHLQNLFAKLAVGNRSAALAKARVLNLLAR